MRARVRRTLMQHQDHLDEVVRHAVELRTLSAAARDRASEVIALSAVLVKDVAQTRAAVARARQRSVDLRARQR